jgi:Gnt-I system high-affinity gluconate transporter
MTIFAIIACILGLVLLISWGRVNAFLAFLIIAIVTGLVLGIPGIPWARSLLLLL